LQRICYGEPCGAERTLGVESSLQQSRQRACSHQQCAYCNLEQETCSLKNCKIFTAETQLFSYGSLVIMQQSFMGSGMISPDNLDNSICTGNINNWPREVQVYPYPSQSYDEFFLTNKKISYLSVLRIWIPMDTTFGRPRSGWEDANSNPWGKN